MSQLTSMVEEIDPILSLMMPAAACAILDVFVNKLLNKLLCFHLSQQHNPF
jgi:hypothetical protein